jgi:AraC family transcriptional regulator
MTRNPAPRKIGSIAAGAFSITEMLYPSGTVQQRHAHSTSGITLVLAGSLEETVACAHEYARSLSVVVKPLDTEHANRIGDGGARTLQIRIASSAFENELRVLGAWRWCHRGAVVKEFLNVLRCFRARAAEDAETAIYDLIGSARANVTTAGNPPQWLEQVREQIDELLPSAVRVRDVAQSADVHPVYLARQFRRFFGCSVTEYVAARRLQCAADLLACPNWALAAAAYRAGYADQSHLTRSFRDSTGETPGSYRKLMIG